MLYISIYTQKYVSSAHAYFIQVTFIVNSLEFTVSHVEVNGLAICAAAKKKQGKKREDEI